MTSNQTAFTELPVVDVSGLYSHDPADRAKVADGLGKAAREVGFLYVTGHHVGKELRQRLLDQAKRFFAQPEDRKMDIYIGKSGNHRGYVPEGEEVMVGGKRDRKEALDLGLELAADDPLVLAGTPMVGPNQWPDLPDFARTSAPITRRSSISAGTCCAASPGARQGRDLLRPVRHPPAEPVAAPALSFRRGRRRRAGHRLAH